MPQRARSLGTAIVSALLLLCTAPRAAARAPTLATEMPPITRTQVGPELMQPWGLAITAAGDVFYSEKCLGLFVLPSDGAGGHSSPVHLYGNAPAALVAPDFFCEGQSGAHGVALDPDYATNGAVFLFAPSMPTGGGRPFNHVVRMTVAADLSGASDRVDIVDDIFFKAAATDNGSAGSHSGGRIRFGPDDLLYITTGDNHNGTLPQDVNALGGKIVRVDRDGVAAPGNAAPAGGDPRIFAYGLRNVQGIAFQPGTDTPYIAEHGPGYDDEVTALVPGTNGGWDPQDRPSLTCPDDYCGYAGTPETMPMTDTARFPDAVLPAWVYSEDQRGIGPAEFLSGPQWGEWDGRLLVAEMGAEELWLLRIGADGNADGETLVTGTAASNPFEPFRYRALQLGPDGALYAALEGAFGTDVGFIRRFDAAAAVAPGAAASAGATPAAAASAAGPATEDGAGTSTSGGAGATTQPASSPEAASPAVDTSSRVAGVLPFGLALLAGLVATVLVL